MRNSVKATPLFIRVANTTRTYWCRKYRFDRTQDPSDRFGRGKTDPANLRSLRVQMRTRGHDAGRVNVALTSTVI